MRLTTPLYEPQPGEPHMTVDDYYELPSGDGTRYEILDGVLATSPAPTIAHQRISRTLLGILMRRFMAGRGEVFYAPVDVVLAQDTVAQPDLIVVRHVSAAVITRRGIEGPPDLVVEIVSPGTERHDRVTKRRSYAKAGIPVFWLVLPDTRELIEYVLEEGKYQIGAQARAPVLFASSVEQGLTVDIDALFANPFGDEDFGEQDTDPDQ